MKERNIFEDKNVNLFSPYSNEYLFDYISLLGFKDEDSKDWKSRHVVLSVLECLFRLNIIYVYSWCNQPELENKPMTFMVW